MVLDGPSHRCCFGLAPLDVSRFPVPFRLGVGSFRGTLRTLLFALGLRREALLLTLETGLLTLLFDPLMLQFGEETSFPPSH